jgi:hypothetical protein
MLNFYKATGIVIAIVLLAACGQSDRYIQDKSPSRPDMPGGTGAVILPSSSPDYALPPQSPANAAEAPASSNSKTNPLSELTKQEESAAMPIPRQANDHSSDPAKTPKN